MEDEKLEELNNSEAINNQQEPLEEKIDEDKTTLNQEDNNSETNNINEVNNEEIKLDENNLDESKLEENTSEDVNVTKDTNKELENKQAEEAPVYKQSECFQATVDTLRNLLKSFNYYTDLQTNFNEGKTVVELKKKFMLKVLDERWVRAIEDTIPAIDTIIRNPTGNLEEFSEVRPIELTRKVTTESIIYLSQHTDDINEIYDDGSVMPSRLLNVYHDETMFTYENKFINTLINRLGAFVMMRYDAAVACGQDEKKTCLTYTQTFEQNMGDEVTRNGKINVTIEITEPPSKDDEIKNYIYATDLWRRVENIVDNVKNFMVSPFVRTMEKNFIRPPVLRTNKLLKNVNFNQCLQLWEFIEGYDNTGYETLVSESLEKADDEFLVNFNNSVAAQYALFQKNICNDVIQDKVLDSRMSNVFVPKIVEELDEFKESDYELHEKVAEVKDEGLEQKNADEIDLAIQVALAHDDEYWKALAEEEEEESTRYNYSYLGRLVKAQDPTLEFYSQIRNKLLSYKDVETVTNWKQEVFSLGKDKLVKLVMRGKTINFQIALDPTKYVDTKYKYINLLEKKPKEKFPMLLKIKNQKMATQACDLIDELMNDKKCKKIGLFKPIDYHVRPIELEEMLTLDPPLVREVGADNGLNIRTLKMDIMDLLNLPVKESEPRYDYSYLGRLIRAELPTQDFYSVIRNKVLSYNKTESVIGWKQETFTFKNDKVIKMVMRGKTINLSLAMDPKPYIEKEYKVVDLREKKPKEKMPALIKIKNQKTLKQACEMIDDLINQYALEQVEDFKEITYHIANLSYDQMVALDPPLAREVGKTEVNIRTVRFDIMSLLDLEADENAVLEEIPVEEEDSEAEDEELDLEDTDSSESDDETESDDESDEDSDDDTESDETETPDLSIVPDAYITEDNQEIEPQLVDVEVWENRYVYSFQARLIKYGEPNQTYYEELKNELLSYDGVTSRLSFKHDAFKKGRQKLAKMVIRGKSLRIYLMLDPKEYENTKYIFTDVTIKKPNAEYPFLMKISSPRKLKYAKELIADLMAKFDITKLENPEVLNYHLEPETREQMIEEGLVKVKQVKVIRQMWQTPEMIKEALEKKKLEEENVINQVEETATSDEVVNEEETTSNDVVNEVTLEETEVLEETNESNVEADAANSEELDDDDTNADELDDDTDSDESDDESDDGFGNEETVPVEKLEKPEDVITIDNEVIEPKLVDVEVMVDRYNYSLDARLIKLGEPVQTYYSDIKNDLLSYDGVVARKSFRHETYKHKRNKLAKIVIRGKHLRIYLNLNPTDYENTKYRFTDLRIKKPNAELPFLMKISSPRKLKYSGELINDLMAKNEINKLETTENIDYHQDNQTLDEMIQNGLVKVKQVKVIKQMWQTPEMIKEELEKKKLESENMILESNQEINLEETSSENNQKTED